ncbi:MAG: hypothetical protein ACLT3Y_09050 [Ruminococcus callidus]
MTWKRADSPWRSPPAARPYTIVYNGELYNTPELRTQLEQEGVVFQTHCDTEVVLQSYAHWGPRCVEQCNGIFAFAVWEHTAQRLFLARDRIGVKPLFYAEIPGGLVFGSRSRHCFSTPMCPTRSTRPALQNCCSWGRGGLPAAACSAPYGR